jgi:hypothetical protein
MSDLYLHSRTSYNRRLESVFELLGSHENDITYSTGWVLARCPDFLRVFLRRIFPAIDTTDEHQITLQDYRKNGGITDVEIFNLEVHTIIEAKRGWNLPGIRQLSMYASRLRASESQNKALVVMAECSAEYAAIHLPRSIKGIPVHYLSWKTVHNLSRLRTSKHSEKHLLQELRIYLRRIVKMQDQTSNMVFVAALATGRPRWSRISWRDIVNEKRRYFHPFGRDGWPKQPPNYIGFRYDGRLQSIHHVKSSKVVDDLHSEIPEIQHCKWQKGYIIYTLGPSIRPSKEVRTGKIFRAARVQAMLDLLLTCKTISQARNLTQERLSEIE